MNKSSYRILTVDDHRISLRLLERQLETLGFVKIESVRDGLEAESRLAEEHFDIVLLDWAMPKKDGLTLLKECRPKERFRHTAFGMISAEAHPHMIAQSKEAGALVYLTKPVTQDALAKEMETVLAWLGAHARPARRGLLDEVLNSSGSQLVDAMSETVMKTIETLFGRKLQAGARAAAPATADYCVVITLTQGEDKAQVRLVFDRPLLETLVSGIYRAEELRDEVLLRDAAMETANIICGRIKAFVNGKGLHTTMDLPAMADKSAAGAAGQVSLNFSLAGDAAAPASGLRVEIV